MFDPTCVYKTPCGWCSKWDKECDNKLGEYKPEVNNIPLVYGKCFGCINYPSETNGLCKSCNPKNNYVNFEGIKISKG